jgi:type II secretory pathway component PulF
MFNEFEAELPLPTKLLMAIVGFVTGYWFYILPVIMGTVVLAVWYVKTPDGREMFDRLLLRIPIVGMIIAQREMARFSRTMAISLDAGLPMFETMDLIIQTAQNSVIRSALQDMRTQMVEGRGLFQSMASNELFPALLVQMVKVGEQVGTLSKDLTTVADMYEQDVDDRVDTLLSLMQPALLLGVGLIVAFIAISVVLPMYSIMGEI